MLAPPRDRPSVSQQSARPESSPAPTYGPVARYPVPGEQSAPGPAPAPLTAPTGTGYPPVGYPTVGYPPGADPYPSAGYPPRAPDPHPPVQPTPAPAVPTAAPAVAPNAGPPPVVVESASPGPSSQAHSPGPTSGPSAPPAGEPAPPVLGWVAVLDDGRQLTVDRLVLLGRNPRPEPGEEDAQLVKLADETRTVSKVHLAMGIDAAGLFVVDRGSTNGSTVTSPGGASKRCQPGEVIYVSEGSIVSMGDHWLEVRRGEG